MGSLPSKQINVWFFVDAWFPFIGGGQIYARELSNKIEQNHLCSVRMFYPPHPHIIIRFIWTIIIPFRSAVMSLYTKVDLIHSQGYNSGLAGKLTSLFIGKPIVHTVHGSNLLDLERTGLKARVERWLLTQIKYDRQISVTRSFLKYPNVNKVTHIPNGVDIQSFDVDKTERSVKPSILWVGRNDPVKGLDIFDKAVGLLKLKYPEVLVDIVVDGKLSKQEIVSRYKRAHIFVQSSRSEGLSLALLEAWAAKLAVVATAVGDNPRLINSGANGLLVPPEKPEALAGAITSLLDKPQTIKRMGQKGYELAKQKYSWDRVAQETLRIYQAVL